MTETEQPKEERIIEMDVQRLRDFRNHPFKIRNMIKDHNKTENNTRILFAAFLFLLKDFYIVFPVVVISGMIASVKITKAFIEKQ